MLRRKKLFARLAVLAVLLSCLGFVVLTPNTQTVLALPCCETCPIPPGEIEPTPQEYCTDQCGASSGSCYNNYVNQELETNNNIAKVSFPKQCTIKPSVERTRPAL